MATSTGQGGEQVPHERPSRPASPSDEPGGRPRFGTYPPGAEADAEQDWHAGWESGTWDTDWATRWQQYRHYTGDGWAVSADGEWADTGAPVAVSSRGHEALSPARIAEAPMGRLARVRLIFRVRPGAGSMLVIMLLGFVLIGLSPVPPLMRISYDIADASRHAAHLQVTIQGDRQELLKPGTLSAMQGEVDGIQHDLDEISAVANVVPGAVASVNPALRDDQLLLRIGNDLTLAAHEGLQVAQTLVSPFQGGVLSGDDGPGLTPADVHAARYALAEVRMQLTDALAVYQQLDQKALPAELRPGSKYGALLALLPAAIGALDEFDRVLDLAPGLLGIGQPAYYLVIAMDRTELRPGGGFQGNWGILTLSGGKQPKDQPLALQDVYKLDEKYYQRSLPEAAKQVQCDPGGKIPPAYYGPQPPQLYWWWSVRNFACDINWGLRDANLSPDFPTNARAAIAITQAADEVPGHGQLQGVVAFTSTLIEDLLELTGPITLPEFPNAPPITPQNMDYQIHCHQLGACAGSTAGERADRKAFTHSLAQELLSKVKLLKGGGLRQAVEVALQALKTKDLQIYFADPRVELLLQQLHLAATINTASGDGFFVVDTNDGGNKANAYVTERQQDLVTLLPDGGALHRLEITVIYHKTGPTFVSAGTPEDYNEVQRIYIPGNATLLGYAGFSGGITDCRSDKGIHCLLQPSMLSDVPGRSMLMGLLDLACTEDAHGMPVYNVGPALPTVIPNCTKEHISQQVIDVQWYTPDAWTATSGGHGTYSELVEKQAGTEVLRLDPGGQEVNSSIVHVSIYVDTRQVQTGGRATIDWADATLRAATLKSAHQIFDQDLNSDTPIIYSF